MIPKRYITQWIENAPWQDNAQIEQDLQYKQGPIGELMTAIHQTLDPWLGKPKYKQSQGRVTFFYGFETENAPVRPMKIKVEINTREHGSELPLKEVPFTINNGWFSAKVTVKTYQLEELMATKLRALYQRRKGRDLFDLHQTLLHFPTLNTLAVVCCFKTYLEKENLKVSRAEFEKNMSYKLQDAIFQEDIFLLLPYELAYDQWDAYELVHKKIISELPGGSWEGSDLSVKI
jgi:hypothetical protein